MAGMFGSSHFGTKPFLADAMRSTGKQQPVALYFGAANGDDPGFGTALSDLITAAGARKVLWPKLGANDDGGGRVRAALEQADLVFVGGGDVGAGMQAVREAGLNRDFRAAAERGVVFAGMSAGSIMLGERWIRWPRDDAPDSEAETYECLGIVPCSLDTHGEGDQWRETKSFAAVRARELGKKARAYGVPSGGALQVDADGTLRARGAPVPVFAASPNEAARVEQTLDPNP